MNLNWSTLIFEIVNFLILLWILQRFLYKPVLAVISQRRENIEKTLSDAQQLRREAEALQESYQSRLTEWEQEKQTARETLHRDIELERTRRLELLEQTIDQEHEKARVIGQRRLQEALRQSETQAVEQAARFAARLLQRMGSPALEKQLIDLTLEELGRLPDDQRETLRTVCQSSPTPCPATLISAYRLDDEQQQSLRAALSSVIDAELSCTFSRDPGLIAGLRISIGPWVLQANLRDELKSFAGIADVV